MGQIQNITVVAASVVPLRLSGGSRTIIRCDGNDVRIAYERDLLGTTANQPSQFFTIKDGEAFVFDPNPITGTTAPELDYRLYCTVSAGVDATLQVWLQGKTQGA